MTFRSIAGASSAPGFVLPAVNKPAGTVSGDILIMVVSQDETSVTISFPSGFTSLPSSPLVSTVDNQMLACAIKVAGGAEPSTYTPTSTDTIGESIVVLAAYQGDDITTPPETSSGLLQGAAASVATFNATGLTTTSDGDDVIWIAGSDLTIAGPETWTVPSGYNDRGKFINTRQFSTIEWADIVQGTHGATGTVSGTDSFTGGGNTGRMVFFIALKPLAGGGTTTDFGRRIYVMP